MAETKKEKAPLLEFIDDVHASAAKGNIAQVVEQVEAQFQPQLHEIVQ